MTRQLHPEIFKTPEKSTPHRTQDDSTPTQSKNDSELQNQLSSSRLATPPKTPMAPSINEVLNENYAYPFEQNQAQVDAVDLQIISMKIDTLQKRIKDLETQIGINGGRIDEVSKASKLKFESLKKAFQNHESATSSRLQSHKSHMVELSGKLTTHRLRDNKIEELMQRQNQMVLNFEDRMKDMKKVISEQQYQIMNLKGALKEALRRLHR